MENSFLFLPDLSTPTTSFIDINTEEVLYNVFGRTNFITISYERFLSDSLL